MSYWQDLVDEINGAIRITTLANCSATTRRLTCPFHGGQGDLAIKADQNKWRCFGRCDDGYWKDIFDWVALQEGISRVDAIKFLGAQLGLASNANQERARILNEAMVFYEEQLRGYDRPRLYLHNRGFDESLWFRSRLGYAPQGARPPLPPVELAQVGLLVPSFETHRPWFNDHLVLPIWDKHAVMTHMQGRVLDAERMPKYLALNNDGELRGPNMERCVGNAHSVHRWAGQRVYCCEGFPDRLTLDAVGLNAVNVFGHGGLDRLGYLFKTAREVIFLMDPDAASQNETHFEQLARLSLLNPTLPIKTVVLNDRGLDTNDWFREAHPGQLISPVTHAGRRDELEALATATPPLLNTLIDRWSTRPVAWYTLAQLAANAPDSERSLHDLARALNEPERSIRFLLDVVGPGDIK